MTSESVAVFFVTSASEAVFFFSTVASVAVFFVTVFFVTVASVAVFFVTVLPPDTAAVLPRLFMGSRVPEIVDSFAIISNSCKNGFFP